MIRDPYEAPSARTRKLSRRALASHPEKESAIALDGLDDDALASLSRFRELRALRLSTCEIGPRAIAALRSLSALRELHLWRCKVTGEGLEDALSSLRLRSLTLDRPGAHGLSVTSLLPRCASLEALSLDLAGEGETPLFDALSSLPSLRALSLLYAPQVTDETLPRLASLATLDALSLHCCEVVSGVTLDALASLQNLRSLTLVSNKLEREAFERLATLRSLRALSLPVCKPIHVAPLLPLQALESLNLNATGLSASQIAALGDFTKLAHLSISSCGDLTDALLTELGERLSLRALGIASTPVRCAAFEDTARWSQLEQLDAGFTKIDDATMATLAKLPRLKSLEAVYCNELSAKGLARVTEFAALEELNVQGVSAVTDAVVDAWARRPRWSELTVYGCTRVTGRSVVPLMRAHPDALVHCESHRFCDRFLSAAERYDERMRSVALCDDAKLAALVTSTAAVLVERPSGKRRNKKSIASKDAIVRLDPKGRALLTLSKKARLWDAANGAELPSLVFKLSIVDDAAFSADGSRLAITGLQTSRKSPKRLVFLWDVATWTQLGTLEATYSDDRATVALSPDGSHVVIAHSSIEVLSVKSAERVLHIEKKGALACFDAKGDAVLFVDGESVMRAPLDGAAVTSVMQWKNQLERAGGVTVLSERAELAANPDFSTELRELRPYELTLRGGEPTVIAYGGGYPGATGLVVGSRAAWIQCDVYGERPIAITSDAKTMMLGYPQERTDRLAGAVGVWPLDEVMNLASAE